MSQTSEIEWTDATWNPVRGCVKVSPGCKHCYAETFAERFRGVPGHAYEQGFDPRTAPDQLDKPLHWKKPTTIFVNSMSDLFGEFVDRRYIAAVYGIMAQTPRHTYQVLTKRAARLPEWYAWLDSITADHGPPPDEVCTIEAVNFGAELDQIQRQWPLPNVWLGVSVEDRKYGLPRIEHLRRTPAAVRFLSIEPLLEDLGEIDLTGIGWVIVGGESGPGARPMHPAWVRRIREQCIAAKVPFFFKQWGMWEPRSRDDGRPFNTLAAGNRDRLVALDGTVHCTREPAGEEAVPMSRVGKKNSGRILDGRTWDEMPAGHAAPKAKPQPQRLLPVVSAS